MGFENLESKKNKVGPREVMRGEREDFNIKTGKESKRQLAMKEGCSQLTYHKTFNPLPSPF